MHPRPTTDTTWIPLVRFIVPGKPVPKGRPRFAFRGRTVVSVRTDKKTKQYEDRVRFFAVGAMAGSSKVPAGVPVRLDVLAIHPRPIKYNRKKDPDASFFKVTRTGGDLDNHIKAVSDALNGVVYEDDSQVSVIRGEQHIAGKKGEPQSVVTVFVPYGWNS